MRNHGAALIRVDAWTTNYGLHGYLERQRFTRCPGRDPAELDNYPAQALCEREIEQAGDRISGGTRDDRDAGKGKATPVTRLAL